MTTQQAETHKIVTASMSPELAEFKFRVNNEWQDGSQNRASTHGFYGTCQEISHAQPFEFQADEPPVLLGKGEAANPVEYLLTALSSCMTTSLAYHAAAQGIEAEGEKWF